MRNPHFSSYDYPPEERMAHWERSNREQWVDLRGIVGHGPDFRASLSSHSLADLKFAQMSMSPHVVERIGHHNLAQDAGTVVISLITEGNGYLHSDQKFLQYRTGDAMIYPSNARLIFGMQTDMAQFVIQVPQDLIEVGTLPLRISASDAEAGRKLERLRQTVAGLMNGSGRGVQPEVDLVKEQVRGLIRSGSSESHGIWMDARQLMDQNLRDNTLTATRVAQEVGYSLRHLNRVFAEHGTTVAEYLRQARLEGARTDLEQTKGNSLSITSLAFEWGFQNSVTFSKAFTRQYGVTPSRWTSGCFLGVPT